MARRSGRGAGARGKGRQPEAPDYYNRLPSDTAYKKTAHKRAVQGTIKRWLTRLAVVAALVLAWHLWGENIKGLVKSQASATGQEVKQVGGNITEGRDRRSGADWVEGE